ncbi:MAG: thioesterase family protein, partial [Bacteroidota bacterium]
MARVRVDLPEEFPFRTEIPVRVDDINYGGHLGNDAVLSMAHEARLRFLRHLGYSEKDIEGVGIIMTDAAIEYRSESFYGDVLVVDVGVADMEKRSCDIVYRMRQKESDKEVARVKTGVVFFDYTTRRVVAVP